MRALGSLLFRITISAYMVYACRASNAESELPSSPLSRYTSAMRVLFHLCVCIVLVFARSAHAEDQVLRYVLYLDDELVGHRQIEIRYLAPPDGELDEVRLIRSTLDLDVTLGRLRYTLESRVSAFHASGLTNISASVRENDRTREIQIREERDGAWSVVSLEDGVRSTWNYSDPEVGLTSMDLADPHRYRQLLDASDRPLLVAENGQVSEGRVVDHGEQGISVADQELLAHRIDWMSEAGDLVLHFSESGLLVAYSLDFLDRRLEARLEEIPGDRSWGQFDMMFDEVSEEEP